MTRLHSIQLLGFRDNLHVAHWQAPRKTNEHSALGELYDALLGKIDELTEISISRDSAMDFPEASISISNRAVYADLLAGGLSLIAEIRATLTVGVDDDRLNILADMTADIRRAAYKLEVTLT